MHDPRGTSPRDEVGDDAAVRPRDMEPRPWSTSELPGYDIEFDAAHDVAQDVGGTEAEPR